MSEQIPGGKILDDLPTDIDALDFQPYIDTLADIISSPGTSTPLTIGVFGTWGSGKTSLMRMVRSGLPKSFRTAWFDAWKYDRREDLWRVLLLQVLNAVEGAIPETKGGKANEDRTLLTDMKTSLYRDVDREEVGSIEIDGGKLGVEIAKGAVRIGLSFLPGISTLTKLVEELQKGSEVSENIFDAIRRERTQIHIDQIQFLEQFHSQFSELVEKYLTKNNQRLVVFVDDLDRCLPEKAVEVLESIKLFLDVPGCVFVLGLDQQVVARGIEIKYKEFGLPTTKEGKPEFMIEGAEYLKKIIQLPFQIPPIEREDMSEFVAGLVADWPHEDCPKVFSEGLGDNPREVKRTVNVFLLLWRLAEKRKEKLQGQIKPLRLAKVVAIQHIFPQLYELLKTTPRLLRDLENYYRQLSFREQRGDAMSAGAGEKIPEKLEPPPALANYVNRSAVQRVLIMHTPDMDGANFAPLSPIELRSYFTLTRRAEAPLPPQAELLRQAHEPEMLLIPEGKFMMGADEVTIAAAEDWDEDWPKSWGPVHEVDLPKYWIAKYLVTNTDYAVFVRESGYGPPSDWEDGIVPENKGDYPVVHVNWMDAIVYCRWLSDKTGKVYTLPSEAEWEKAARGANGRRYPWGDEFHKDRCNALESGIGTTTPVGQYSPQGDSSYGLADMAGNVWEWTRSKTEFFSYPYYADDGREDLVDENRKRILRGGAYYDIGVDVQCAVRNSDHPHIKDDYAGFRIAISPHSKH